MLEHRRLVAAKGGQAPGHDHGEPVRTGVHHPGVAQHSELVGPALHRLLAGLERVLEHLGEQLVLLDRGGVGAEALGVHVRQVVGHPQRHRPDGREHGALGRVTHRGVGGIRGARQRC